MESKLDYPGPYCEEIQLTNEDLKTCTINKPCSSLKNGIVLEIICYLENIEHSTDHLLNILKQLNPSFEVSSTKYLKTKVTRLNEQRKKLAAKRKVSGYKNVFELLNAEFRTSVQRVVPSKSADEKTSTTTLQETIVQIENIHVHDSKEENLKSVSVQTNWDRKNQNFEKYTESKLQKHSEKLEKKIQEQKCALGDLVNRIGHFSTRNVNKRDETAKKNLHLLRDSQRANFRQEKTIKELNQKLQDAESEIDLLRQQSNEVSVLKNEVCALKEKIDSERNKKINVQKVNSYLRKEQSVLKTKLEECANKISSSKQAKCDQCIESRAVIREKDTEIDQLKDSLESAQKCVTKKEDGTYSDNIRLCVIELTALEIASEKISPTIQSVSNHLFSYQFDKKDLPNKTSVQSIMDEGHYIGKVYTSTRLEKTTTWGVNRDGTTRKKKKILDTSVTLDNGEIIGLGFTRVAHETAKTIHEVTKKKIEELSELNEDAKVVKESTIQLPPNDNFVVDSLRKLSFTMSDRASNEKLADKCLDEWRDQLLGQCEGEDYEKLHHFHCMAHVLLGFHKYACDDIKSVTQTLEKDGGPLGRDAHPSFKFWGKQPVVQRAARMVSEIFGPAGDHLGLRDRWEATCAKEGIKSLIGNYRDNRFNCIFQTAAEVLVHRDKFLEVIETVQKPNKKITSVQCDLKDNRVMALLQCFGLIYVKVTGPYWNLVTSTEVPYLLLNTHIQELADFLAQCSTHPTTLLHPDGHWNREHTEVTDIPHRKRLVNTLFKVKDDTKDILLQAIQVVSAAMFRTIQKQLSDFIQGGKYAEMPPAKDLENTRYAHSTNLGCEHHFGDLDSSQKRRPNASMHHHSTVQLLKRNRKPMMSWVQEMSPKEREELMKKARKGAKILREKNLSAEKEVLKEITEDMLKEKAPKKRRKTNTNKSVIPVFEDSEEEYDSDGPILPVFDEFCLNDYIAVAYQDGWYPGIVLKSDGKKASVKFMSPCKRTGYFSWPQREDVQSVSNEFVLKKVCVPECINYGRQWFFSEYLEIDSLFKLYEKKFF